MTSRPREQRRWSAQEIAEDLRSRIQAGEFSEGSQLPATRKLVEEYYTSPETLRQAVLKLKSWGLVTSRQGKGVFVRVIDPIEWHVHSFERGERRDDPARGVDDWKASIEELGRVPSQDTPVVTVERAPEDIAKWLELKPGSFAVARRRLRRVDGVPFQLADSWFPTEVAMDSPLMEERDVTMAGGILKNIGHPQVRRRHIVRSWLPTDEEIKRLDLDPDATHPVTRHTLIGYGADGKPVRCMVTIAPGDRNVLIYDFEE
ncbi:GntR family transcriptional regulator [Streptomyces sp. NEAU-PBA10]|uniref:GntR family transcriptional regulator n=1 Tax=Streptomyces tremellae TaxID=1124239 RepID=A0ABP7DX26_9ACTN|nr:MULTISPECIES: GntR family transcriptional regulator [Streptomyces]